MGTISFVFLQTIVQRSLAAKNISHAKGGALMAAVLKISPMYLIVMPGMIARILLPSKTFFINCAKKLHKNSLSKTTNQTLTLGACEMLSPIGR